MPKKADDVHVANENNMSLEFELNYVIKSYIILRVIVFMRVGLRIKGVRTSCGPLFFTNHDKGYGRGMDALKMWTKLFVTFFSAYTFNITTNKRAF